MAREGACADSVFLRDRDRDAVKLIDERKLTRETGQAIAARRTIEKVILVLGGGRQQVSKSRVDMDMTRRTRTTTAAKGEKFVEAVITNNFHNGETRFRFNAIGLPGPVDDIQLRHLILR